MNEVEQDVATGHRVSRRAVVMAGGAIGVAGVIAACGGGSDSGATTPAADPTSAAPSPTGGSASPTGESSAPAPGGDALAPVSDIPVGGGQVFDGPKVVVTQPEEGTIKGFTAVCPHQGCLVNQVTDNQIVCPCHGSLFSAVDGAVIQGPAVQGLAAAAVQVVDGNVVLG